MAQATHSEGEQLSRAFTGLRPSSNSIPAHPIDYDRDERIASFYPDRRPKSLLANQFSIYFFPILSPLKKYLLIAQVKSLHVCNGLMVHNVDKLVRSCSLLPLLRL